MLYAGVVAGGDVLRFQDRSAGGQEVELDLVVAGDAGVGCAALLVLGAEVVDYVVLELLLHVQHVVGYAQPVAHHAGVLHVVHGAAASVVIGQVGLVQAVKLHGDPDHVVPLAL